MIEPQFSDEFNKFLKHLNKNIKNINGIEYYLIPVKVINNLKQLFNSQPQDFFNDQEDDENNLDVEYYKPFF